MKYPIPCYGTKDSGYRDYLAIVSSREALHIIHYQSIIHCPPFKLIVDNTSLISHVCYRLRGTRSIDIVILGAPRTKKRKECAPSFSMP